MLSFNYSNHIAYGPKGSQQMQHGNVLDIFFKDSLFD